MKSENTKYLIMIIMILFICISLIIFNILGKESNVNKNNDLEKYKSFINKDIDDIEIKEEKTLQDKINDPNAKYEDIENIIKELNKK